MPDSKAKLNLLPPMNDDMFPDKDKAFQISFKKLTVVVTFPAKCVKCWVST